MEPASSEKELYRKDNSGRGGNGKLYLVLLVAAVCFAFAAFVIAIVSLSKQTGSSASPSVVNVGLTSADYDKDDKVWLIHGGHAGFNQFYISEKTGKLEGFVPDIINAGYHSNTERRRTFAFADQYTSPPHQTFVTLPGNPKKFDWRNITGKTIAFYNGAYFNEECLAKAEGIIGAVVPPENIRRINGFAQGLEWLKDETVDAIFTDVVLSKHRTEVEEVADHLQACPVDGKAMMTRYDSKLIDWWNPAQAKLIASKEYIEICNDIKVTHGHQPGYDPEDFCIGI
ncbi:uncharacterized protein [Amphiura filiformis]|uniref:uncharacterized protein isoform X2 n=1 Tax=Amphiura filiformis TaxID=82378 RepID=UPI003B2126FC